MVADLNAIAAEDFPCFRMPGTQGTATFNSDQFVMSTVGGESAPLRLN